MTYISFDTKSLKLCYSIFACVAQAKSTPNIQGAGQVLNIYMRETVD